MEVEFEIFILRILGLGNSEVWKSDLNGKD
jgi:hypothetical protein